MERAVEHNLEGASGSSSDEGASRVQMSGGPEDGDGDERRQVDSEAGGEALDVEPLPLQPA